MKHIGNLLVSISAFFIFGCGGGGELKVKGEPEALLLAQSFMDAMGGAKEWSALQSVYIRTITNDVGTAQSFVFEEWISLDEPKFMNRKTTESGSEVQILNGNDGWIIRNKKVSLMPNNGITQMLKWHENFFMTNVKKLAVGSESYEVKINGADRFDFYMDGKFVSGFKLNNENLPDTYFVSIGNGRTSSMVISEWGHYKDLAYPLAIKGQNTMSHFKTDYWDPSKLTAEKAFKISYNPNEMIANQ